MLRTKKYCLIDKIALLTEFCDDVCCFCPTLLKKKTYRMKNYCPPSSEEIPVGPACLICTSGDTEDYTFGSDLPGFVE